MGEEPAAPELPVRRSRIAAFVHSLRSVILIEGGLLNTTRAAYEVLRAEGWAGLKMRATSVLSKDERNDYAEWIRRYDTLDDADRERVRKNILRMPRQPLISIVMPTCNTHASWLQEAIDSVRGQLYENWELCIADDASTDPKVREILQNAGAQDDRIKVTFRAVNGHISAASNSAFKLCTGEWVALLDHDDLLAEHALYCVASTIVANTDAQLIFSDEDKINERGLRFDPYFKCDFNRDLFYSQNMISHLAVYRRHLVEQIGGFQEGYEGSQDYDLALRCLEHIEPREIVHIPRVLYHWRRHSDSTASGGASKPYARDAAQSALEAHLARTGTAAKVCRKPFGYHVRYALPSPPPSIGIVTCFPNLASRRASFIKNIERSTDYPDYEIHLIDSAPEDAAPADPPSEDDLNGNIAHADAPPAGAWRIAVNDAVQTGEYEFVALLDPVVQLSSAKWLSELVAVAAQPGVGAVSPKLVNTRGAVEHAGYVLGISGFAGNAFHRHPGASPCYFGRAGLMSSFSAISSACMVIRRSTFLEIGGFDESLLSGVVADIDLCLRLREAGYRSILNPSVLMTAITIPAEEADERNRLPSTRDLRHIPERWSQTTTIDPCYSPNLTQEYEDFSLGWPPRVEEL